MAPRLAACGRRKSATVTKVGHRMGPQKALLYFVKYGSSYRIVVAAGSSCICSRYQSELGQLGGLRLVLLIHMGGLCPSSGDFNKQMMMIFYYQ
jgi:hypothetical protein